VRIDPNPTQFQPGDDTTPPPGIYAWVTGQNTDVGTDDVDNGVSATRSPLIDLAGQDAARLVLMYFHGQRDPGDDPTGDFFRLQLSNDGGATFPATLVAIGDVTTNPDWRELSVDLQSVLPLTAQMRIRVQAADGPATGDIVEAGSTMWHRRSQLREPPAPAPPPSSGRRTGRAGCRRRPPWSWPMPPIPKVIRSLTASGSTPTRS
jgi:hypothetical protein